MLEGERHAVLCRLLGAAGSSSFTFAGAPVIEEQITWLGSSHPAQLHSRPYTPHKYSPQRSPEQEAADRRSFAAIRWGRFLRESPMPDGGMQHEEQPSGALQRLPHETSHGHVLRHSQEAGRVASAHQSLFRSPHEAVMAHPAKFTEGASAVHPQQQQQQSMRYPAQAQSLPSNEPGSWHDDSIAGERRLEEPALEGSRTYSQAWELASQDGLTWQQVGNDPQELLLMRGNGSTDHQVLVAAGKLPRAEAYRSLQDRAAQQSSGHALALHPAEAARRSGSGGDANQWDGWQQAALASEVQDLQMQLDQARLTERNHMVRIPITVSVISCCTWMKPMWISAKVMHINLLKLIFRQDVFMTDDQNMHSVPSSQASFPS